MSTQSPSPTHLLLMYKERRTSWSINERKFLQFYFVSHGIFHPPRPSIWVLCHFYYCQRNRRRLVSSRGVLRVNGTTRPESKFAMLCTRDDGRNQEEYAKRDSFINCGGGKVPRGGRRNSGHSFCCTVEGYVLLIGLDSFITESPPGVVLSYERVLLLLCTAVMYLGFLLCNVLRW